MSIKSNGDSTIPAGTGAGDVSGPASSDDNAIARFDGITGKLLQNTANLLVSDAGLIGFPDGVRQIFNPDGTVSGVNVGEHTADPGTLVDGDIWYNSTDDELKARIDGNTVVLASGSQTYTVGVTIDGLGDVPSTGQKGYRSIPVTGTIVSARLLADQVGDAVMDVWLDTFANYPPTVADTITASAKPTISSDDNSEDTTLTGWTTAVTAGDVLGFNLDSIDTIQRITLELEIEP